MQTSSFIYPPEPANRTGNMIEPNGSYRSEVFKVAWAILFFLIVYLMLVAAGCILAAFCAYCGFELIVTFPRLMTIMIGIGLLGLGVMVLFFLLKFIVKRNKSDRSGLIELRKEDQPELFAFVRQLTLDTKAPFPKKIYLSPDVNACVFYDSSFWSMIFPVRKNLQIGMGLVNSVNMSELKAVLAHEFGHFSQSSMKLGSYVYNVNKIIYNMLYDNAGYGSALQSWASVSSYFAVFANITVGIVNGIQTVLKEVYKIVNRSHSSLSIQMEFHADAVAAYVSGSDHLISALRRIEMSEPCYQKVLSCYNTYLDDNLKADNFYPQHLEVMKHFAIQYDIPLDHELPVANTRFKSHTSKSRLVIKDQWASHPSTDDREAHLKAFDLHTEIIHTSAWTIFRNPELLQKQMTDMLYQTVKFKTEPRPLSNADFCERYFREADIYKLNKAYKGFYDNRDISVFDPVPMAEPRGSETAFSDLFNESRLQLPGEIAAMESDYESVSLIAKGNTGIKTFEYDGKKYRHNDSVMLGVEIKKEITGATLRLNEADRLIFHFFHDKAEQKGKGSELVLKYEMLFKATSESKQDQEKLKEVLHIMKPLGSTNPYSVINSIMTQVKIRETFIRKRLSSFLEDPNYKERMDEKQRKILTQYLEMDRAYFREPNFDEPALKMFNEAMQVYGYLATELVFRLKKELVELQLSY